ncbi:MAG: methionine ABC transporter permease [Tissierellaceae bacterium]|jgi:D-methionine transport system permease protein|nr:ABC transporter permease [Tissierellia bacterium]
MERIISIVLPAIPETLLMVGVSSLIAVVVGLPLGMILYTSQKGGLSENLTVYKILDGFVNIFRSLPFAVLMLLVMPLTRFIVGRRIGTTASIVPLTITAIPFIARMFEGNFNGLDKGIIEAARAMGSDTLTILRKVVLKESLPQIISTVTMTIINLIGQSAIVGLIGGGGLGDIAIRYGYSRNQMDILYAACIAIIVLVQIVQLVGNNLAKIVDKK